MSGTISRILNVAGGIQNLANFITGVGALQLGPFAFTDYAVPERISYGGSQAMAVHKLVGGARVIDDMGRDDHDISWNGLFLGPNATAYAKQLDQMRMDGDELLLNWGSYNVDVVIRDLVLTGQYNRISYQITCVVLSDDIVNSQSPLASLLGDDVANAINTATSQIQPILSQAQTALDIAGQFGIGSPALSGVLGTLNTAGVATEAAVIASGSALTALSGTSTLLANASDASAAAANSQDLAGSAVSNGYIGRAIQNTTLAVSG